MKHHYLKCAYSFLFLATASFFIPTVAFGQATTKPTPDTLILVDGEKLIGHLESADSKQVTFKSDIAGEIKVDWAKVQDLQSSSKFAVAHKGQVFNRSTDPTQVPQGSLAVTDQKIVITPTNGAALTIPVSDTQDVISQADFMHAFEHPRFSQYWTGAAGLGFALVDATQTSKTLTSTLNLVRTVPSATWIDPRYRTTLTFNSSYGTNTSDGVTIKTNIIHGGLEQDEYINPRLFFLAQGTVDHNYSQGLRIQYTLGGGFGWVAYKSAKQELDLKGQLAYTQQQFDANLLSVPPVPERTVNLIGAVVTEDYNRNFEHGVTLHEELSVTPSFNIARDYSAVGILNIGFPITKRIGVTTGFQDSYLNDPTIGFKKNSVQFVTNLTYKID